MRLMLTNGCVLRWRWMRLALTMDASCVDDGCVLSVAVRANEAVCRWTKRQKLSRCSWLQGSIPNPLDAFCFRIKRQILWYIDKRVRLPLSFQKANAMVNWKWLFVCVEYIYSWYKIYARVYWYSSRYSSHLAMSMLPKRYLVVTLVFIKEYSMLPKCYPSVTFESISIHTQSISIFIVQFISSAGSKTLALGILLRPLSMTNIQKYWMTNIGTPGTLQRHSQKSTPSNLVFAGSKSMQGYMVKRR